MEVGSFDALSFWPPEWHRYRLDKKGLGTKALRGQGGSAEGSALVNVFKSLFDLRHRITIEHTEHRWCEISPVRSQPRAAIGAGKSRHRIAVKCNCPVKKPFLFSFQNTSFVQSWISWGGKPIPAVPALLVDAVRGQQAAPLCGLCVLTWGVHCAIVLIWNECPLPDTRTATNALGTNPLTSEQFFTSSPAAALIDIKPFYK